MKSKDLHIVFLVVGLTVLISGFVVGSQWTAGMGCGAMITAWGLME